jgi:response regulator NasT
MDGLEAAEEIRGVPPTPVVIVSAFHDQEFVDRALKEHVMAYLIKPISNQTLEASIELAMRRFREFRELHEQAADLQQTLQDRKLIERAKGILMQRAGLSEPDAFKRLQLLSSQKNTRMVEIARMIVEANSGFQS